MRKILNNFLTIVLFLVCASLIGYIVFEIKKSNMNNIGLNYENQRLQGQIDSLLILVDNAETKVDTFYQKINHYHTVYDTIIKKIPVMPPTEQLALVDSLTGNDIDGSLVSGDYAMLLMPRIERVAVGLLQKDRFEKEIIELYKIIDEKTGQVTSLKAVVEMKDGQIKIVMAYLEDSEKTVKQLEKRLITERSISGAVILFLFALLL